MNQIAAVCRIATIVCLPLVAIALGMIPSQALHAADIPSDPRNIATGIVIPAEFYADQPYVVVLPNRTWLCVLTTGAGHEGSGGQYIQSTTSQDQGKTWSAPVQIEKPGGPDASWAMPLLTDFGRVYVFYDYNGDEFGKPSNPDSPKVSHAMRADMLGWYCYRYSDDNGKTWSEKRFRLPVRMTDADRHNSFDGKVQIMWGIGKPIHHEGMGLFSFAKIKTYLLSESEGWIFRSDNILTERDPEKIRWEMLPEGENPIRSPLLGPIQSEHNLASMPEGRLACIYRTVQGHPAIAYSADNGQKWSVPKHVRYSPNGRKVKHPRACPRLWRCKNGKYLLWFHNNGGKDFNGRNPAWVLGGIAKDGILHWSEPEILLYLDNADERTSYPDLIEQDNRYWVTETQKSVARVHEVDPSLFEGLWDQVEDTLPESIVTAGCVADYVNGKLTEGGDSSQQEILSLQGENAFTVEMWVTINHFIGGHSLASTAGQAGNGWRISSGMFRQLTLSFGDQENQSQWAVDPYLLEEDTLHHIVFVVDGGPNIVSVVVDGKLCDGGEQRQFGWGRFDSKISEIGKSLVTIKPSDSANVHRLRVYNRYLRTSEIVQNYRCGVDEK